MAHLLHLDSSASSQNSISKSLAAAFRRAWAEELPEATVTHRDLATDPVPHIDETAISSGFVPAEARSPEQTAAAALRDGLADELLAADALLISSPMYNWSIPSTLKAWIDQALIIGRTLVQGEPNPLAGRPAVFLLSYGGGYTPGAPNEGWDHVEPYLHTVFGKALGMDVTVVSAQLALAGYAPGMDHLIPAAKESRAEAHLQAEQHARKTAGKFTG